jgi:PD-(D/E)XK nuclease superfamily protein
VQHRHRAPLVAIWFGRKAHASDGERPRGHKQKIRRTEESEGQFFQYSNAKLIADFEILDSRATENTPEYTGIDSCSPCGHASTFDAIEWVAHRVIGGERSVVVEVKAVNALHPVYDAQLTTYLTLAGFQAGLLLNFNEVLLKNGLRRLDHPNRYAKTHN